mgnify:CR=1 FL=1
MIKEPMLTMNPPPCHSDRAALPPACVALAAFLLAGCSASAGAPVAARDAISPVSPAIADCRARLDAPHETAATGLDSRRIRLVNWNIKKKSLPNWKEDYGRLAGDRDLILIQEASLRPETVGILPTVPHWSFAPGYQTDDAVTGVLTLSRVAPLARCSLVTLEPLLRTPKATSITEFGLRDRRETLLVVNVHAVNFSLGMGTYRQQFAQIAAVLEGHTGPVILSGDLNTWREGRTRTIEALAERFNLSELGFDDDRRTQVFGRPLDHIYVRGLTAESSVTTDVTSSDHNPLSVTLSM